MMRRLYLTAGLAVLSVLVVTLTLVWNSRQDHDRSCENRRAIVAAFEVQTNALIGASSPPESPEEAKQREKAIENYRADLAEGLAPLLQGCT
jgi:hypothetical protein